MLAGIEGCTAVIVVEVEISAQPTWAEGPLTLQMPNGAVTDSEARSTYFHRRAAGALYGTAEEPRRWHRQLHSNRSRSGCQPVAVEVLAIPVFVAPDRGLLALHVDVEGSEPVEALASLTNLAPESTLGADNRRWLCELLDGCASIPKYVRQASHLVFVTTRGGVISGPYGSAYPGRSPLDQWCFVFASLATPDVFRPDPDAQPDPPTYLSATWRALVLRRGIAFVGQVPDDGTEPYYRWARIYTRSIYLDALLLGEMQRIALHDLADQLSDAGSRPRPEELRALQRRIDLIRNNLWWQHVTHHGVANDLLRSFQAQHRLPSLFEEVQADIDDSARLAALAASERTASQLNLLTIFGLPIAAVLAWSPILFAYGVGRALLAAVGAIALGLALRLGLARRGRDERGAK